MLDIQKWIFHYSNKRKYHLIIQDVIYTQMKQLVQVDGQIYNLNHTCAVEAGNNVIRN